MKADKGRGVRMECCAVCKSPPWRLWKSRYSDMTLLLIVSTIDGLFDWLFVVMNRGDWG